MSAEESRTIRVTGRVQGVGFRVNARREADRLGMTTTAENQSDGSVIMVATGTAEQLDAFIDWVHQGPRLARVDKVEVS